MNFRKLVFSSFLIFSLHQLNAQIVITDADLGNVNDTIRYSVKQTLPNFDQTLTGANYNWDYSFLVPDSQRVDKLVPPASTGYPFVAFLSTYGLVNPHPDQIPFALLGSAPTNAYNFYKKSTAQLTIAVMGVTSAGTALPIPLNPADVVYKLPLNYGNIDSSTSGYAYPLTGFGYFRKQQKRVNTVDGWGMLTTPYGTFNTIRVKSVITVNDSLYLDTLGFGFNIPATTSYEFKWLAQGEKFPVLEIDAAGAVIGTGLTVNQVLFKDSLWSNMSFVLYPSNTCPDAKQGSVEVDVTGGRYPHTFSWSNGSKSSIIKNLDAGSYNVTITDKYGRSAIGYTTVSSIVDDASCLNIPNGFTPDGDGVNDYWVIHSLNQFKNCKVEIFNQWGSLIFSSKGYNTPWDGRYNNQPVEAGTYYYVIDLGNDANVFKGSVTVIK